MAAHQGKGDDSLLGCSDIRYSAPFVCGVNPGAPDRVKSGRYASHIQIHNPSDNVVTFEKKLSISFPPYQQLPGEVSRTIREEIGPCETIMVDCHQIFTDNEFDITIEYPYIIGVLWVNTPSALVILQHQSVEAFIAILSPSTNSTNSSAVPFSPNTQPTPPPPPGPPPQPEPEGTIFPPTISQLTIRGVCFV